MDWEAQGREGLLRPLMMARPGSGSWPPSVQAMLSTTPRALPAPSAQPGGLTLRMRPLRVPANTTVRPR